LHPRKPGVLRLLLSSIGQARRGSRTTHSTAQTEGIASAGVQVNKLEITADKQYLAAVGNPHVRLYEVNSNNPQPIQTYDAHSGNVTAVAAPSLLSLCLPRARHSGGGTHPCVGWDHALPLINIIQMICRCSNGSTLYLTQPNPKHIHPPPALQQPILHMQIKLVVSGSVL